MSAERKPYSIGQGRYGEVMYDPSTPGKVFKVPYSEDGFDEIATKEEETHRLLKQCNIPTIPEFNVHYGGYFTEMTDLTAGGRHLVVSIIDMLGLDVDERRLLCGAMSNRPIWNGTEFFDQLAGIFEKGVRHHIRFSAAAPFLVVKGGELETCMGDFHDAVQLDCLDKPYGSADYRDMLRVIDMYLYKVVTPLFPALAPQAAHLSGVMNNQYNPARSPDLPEAGSK
ncbi:MAG: hypothetical protein NUV52_03170 [Candidatus Roizmanbacteria bacterium]|nr:hypothetical protein [Candidatus Roizmanbacteria bacterium]